MNSLWEAAQINTWPPPPLNVWAWGPGCLSLLSPDSSQKPGFILDLEKVPLWSHLPPTIKDGSVHSSPHSPSRPAPAEFTPFPDKNARNFHHFLWGMTKEAQREAVLSTAPFPNISKWKGYQARQRTDPGQRDKWGWEAELVSLWGFSSKLFASLVAESSLCGFANPNGVDILVLWELGVKRHVEK